MYCRNCGNEMHDEAIVCVKCGVPTGKGDSYCSNCGAQTHPDAVICVSCGKQIIDETVNAEPEVSQKSKLAAGLLGIFLGTFGVHNFYLGNTKKAVIQLLLGTIGAFICGIGTAVASIWGVIEGILILCDSTATDSEGKKLQ